MMTTKPKLQSSFRYGRYRSRLSLLFRSVTMAKFLLVVAALASSASAFAPVRLATTSTTLDAFANGYVGGEGPEPIPFSSQGTSVNWDPCGFAEVRDLEIFFEWESFSIGSPVCFRLEMIARSRVAPMVPRGRIEAWPCCHVGHCRNCCS
jgi:hypothetical protein